MPNIFCLKDVWANGEVGLYLIQIGTSLWTLLLTWNELLQCKVEFGKSHKGYICTFACRSGLVSGSAGLFTPNCLESNSNLSQNWFRLFGCQCSTQVIDWNPTLKEMISPKRLLIDEVLIGLLVFFFILNDFLCNVENHQ